MKIALGSWAFAFGPYSSKPVSFEDTVKKLSSAGYDGVEVCGFPPHVTLDKYPNSKSRDGLLRFIKDHKLETSGYAADFSSAAPTDPANRQSYLDLFRRNVELCRDLEIPAIRVDTVVGPDALRDTELESARSRVADLWRECAEIAAAAPVRLVWEFEPGFAFNKPSEVRGMAERVGHRNFGVLFDTSHAYMCGVVGARQRGPKETLPGGVAEFLRLLEGHIGHIHLIDSDGSLHNDETSTHAPFGTGNIDFRALAPLLLAVPAISWWCIDMCFWDGAWELVEESREYIANLLSTSAKA